MRFGAKKELLQHSMRTTNTQCSGEMYKQRSLEKLLGGPRALVAQLAAKSHTDVVAMGQNKPLQLE